MGKPLSIRVSVVSGFIVRHSDFRAALVFMREIIGMAGALSRRFLVGKIERIR
jgi:hypothetical protein